MFKQTVANFEPLYKRLKQRQIDPVMREGLWMMVESMLARNYLAALDVYLRWGAGAWCRVVCRAGAAAGALIECGKTTCALLCASTQCAGCFCLCGGGW